MTSRINRNPLSASELTMIAKSRAIFGNYVSKVQTTNSGCVTSQSGMDGGKTASSSIIPEILMGASFTTPEEYQTIVNTLSCPAPPISIPVAPTPPPVVTGGSMVFSSAFGVNGSQVTYPNSASLAIGSQSFTIEWFQYWTAGSAAPRIFSIGSYANSTIDIAVSYEGSIFYLWTPTRVPNNIGSVPAQNSWVHVAIVGTSATNIKVYVNGILIGTKAGAYNFTNSSLALAIGNETVANTTAAFSGQITNFRWVVGTAIYTTNFTVPTAPLTAVAGTQLLLSATTNADVVKDSSTASRTPTNTGVTFSATTPF